MIFIICALKCEASPLISMLGLRPSRERGSHYTAPGIFLAVSGPGMENIRKTINSSASLYKNPHDSIINIGVCGCTDESIAPGSMYSINQIRNYTDDAILYPDMLIDSTIQEAGCTSYDKPLTSSGCPTLLADMEAYWFFESAARHFGSSRIHIIKVVSDHMEPSGLTKNDISRLINMNRTKIGIFIDSVSRLPEPPVAAGLDYYYDKYRFTRAMRIELDRLNIYHKLKYGDIPDKDIYAGFSIPNEKKDCMRIFNEIKTRLV